jgi:hypothetical protein
LSIAVLHYMINKLILFYIIAFLQRKTFREGKIKSHKMKSEKKVKRKAKLNDKIVIFK